ncbi:MAG: tRNA (uridine(34)/cytosine(34)/5-carboxymethylaminomethyluridine(34)-2'-O)-methyltransferase TrmL [Opitutae bacterium]|nr:tRNA (uridine(34)/cytosine(34)/5-carboxymethylaminomethyluridine(34)-2'-O)-methyltransferase TrmL [Opitutae bacterium]
MIHLILFQPEIPQNTGNVGRLCAYAGCRLHLIKPYGFEIDEKRLRRAGMDYWQSLDLVEHDHWEAFLASTDRPRRIHLLSTKGERGLWDTEFNDGDGLLFGNEGAGLPDEIHHWAGSNRVKIPQYKDSLRSLNLSTAAAIATYEALRQIRP